MARNDPQMNLRVPVELKEKIEKSAFENNRTITAEAVSRLEQSFNPPAHVDTESVQGIMNKVMADTLIKTISNIIKGLDQQGVEWEKVQAALKYTRMQGDPKKE